MNNGVLTALQRLERLSDDVFSGLCQHLDCHIVRNHVPFNQGTQKVVLRLGCRRKTDFDLLESDFNQELKELQLGFHIHRHNQCLVSVPKIHRAPHRCMVDIGLIRPPVTGVRRLEELSGIFLGIHHRLSPL